MITSWKHVFTELPLVDEETGENTNYTVEEVEIEGYKTSITGDAQAGFTITNTEEETIIE